MSRSADYVLVQVMQQSGILLAIKATITGFTYDQFKKGTVVEVVQPNKYHGANFAVRTIFKADNESSNTGKGVYVHLNVGVKDADAFRRIHRSEQFRCK